MTKEIADVAKIAQKRGFKVSGADILRAQASRVLSLPLEELKEVAAGRRAQSGAQWGREGKGYLERVGFWLLEFERWECKQPFEDQRVAQLLAAAHKDSRLCERVLGAKTGGEVAHVASEIDLEISGTAVIQYLAKQILLLDEEKAEQVSFGAGTRVV